MIRPATPLSLAPAPTGSIDRGEYPELLAGRGIPSRGLLPLRRLIANCFVRAAARNRVVAGPFCGMKVTTSALSRRYLSAYLLGTHELELRPVLSRIIARPYGTILNIGTTDGYYAIGLLLRSPTTDIEAFAALPACHSLIRRAARRNRVSHRIHLNGRCDAETLRRRLQSAALPALVLIDAEGSGTDLCELRSVPELRRADILVETNEYLAPHLTDALIDRFWCTHNVECYTAQFRILADFPPAFLSIVPRWLPHLALELMDEQRVGVQHWLFLTAKSESRSGGFNGREAMPVKEGKSE